MAITVAEKLKKQVDTTSKLLDKRGLKKTAEKKPESPEKKT